MASSSPNLTEPSSEQVSPGGTVAVSGGYSDSFAQSNPGMLYLDITDSSGLLSADDTSGNPVAGSGSNTIALSTTYADVNAILGSLQYTAGATSGSDSIRVDVWNQAGAETTGSVPVTITSGGTPTTESWTGAVSGDWNNAANWSGGTVPTSGDTVQIYGGDFTNNPTLSDAVLTGETIDIAGGGYATPLVTLNNVTVNSLLEGGNGARVSIGGTLTIGSQGTLLTTGNTFRLAGTAETIVNNGLIASQTNGDMNIINGPTNSTAAATLINNGSIDANGGQISLTNDSPYPGAPPQWNLLNSGSVAIGNDGGLTLNGTLNGGQVAFNGPGTLGLQQAQALAGGATLTGFGQGDQIALASALGTITAFNNGTLDVGTQNGGLTETIPLAGSYTYGNFEQLADTYPNTLSQVVYAAGGSTSGQLATDIVSPASGTVAQGGTLSLDNVSIQTSGTSTNTPTLTITAGSGTLYSPGETGSGTSQITISGQTIQQLNADLQNTSYVPAAGAGADTVTFDLGAGSYVPLLRSIPLSIGGGSGGGGSGPALNEPSSETVAADGTVAVSGSYSDSFAAGNPGAMYLHISDTSGTLSATNASGSVVAGSGSNSITVSTDYTDVNAVLHSLTYVAGAGSGSDTISFDLWNQAGHETTGSVPVTISGTTGTGGPALTEPSSESVAANGTVAVSGSYSDSFAQSNPGQLWLGISDSSGTLSSTDASGAAVAGSGSNSIGLSTDYVDLNTILANLHYTAGGSAGSDTIHFDVWNQAGVETTAATAVTIGSMAGAMQQASSAMMADFAAPSSGGSGTLVPDNTASVGSSSAMLATVGQQPTGIPLTLHG